VVHHREQISSDHLFSAIQDGIDQILNSGTSVVGDISSSGISRQAFIHSELSGVWFQEYLGSRNVDLLECRALQPEKRVSVAGHGPHTTGSDLLVTLKSAARRKGMVFSLHLAESAEEVAFLTGGKGPWADFLRERNIDMTAVKLTGASPVAYADQLNLLDENTLAVHLVFADQKDIRLLAEKKVHVCLCPRSNQTLHQILPDVSAMLGAGLNLCLGTDSLASNDSLNLFDEMAYLAQSFPDISPADFIAMATKNGAAALGFENRFGRMAPGYAAKMIYLPLVAKDAHRVQESIVTSDFAKTIKTIL
jgi:cytosine/adenosine deaminase-related metal-dependent hydrolase